MLQTNHRPGLHTHNPTMMRLAMMALLITTLFMGACAGSRGKKDKLKGPQPLNNVAILDNIVHMLPQNSTGVLIVDMNRLMNHHLVTAFGLVEKDWNHEAMLADMRRIFKTHYGLDYTKARWALLSGDDDTPVILIKGDMGTPPAEMKQVMGGMTVFVNASQQYYLVQIKGQKNLYAICTDPEHVSKLAALQNGKVPNLKDTEELALIKRILTRVGPGDMTIATLFKNVEDDLLSEVPMGIAQQSGALGVSVSDRLIVALQGDPAELKETEQTIAKAFQDFRDEMAKEINTPTAQAEQDPGQALANIYLYHISGALSDQITPTLEDDLLVYDLAMDTITHPVTIIGGIVGVVMFTFGALLDGLGDMDTETL